MLPVFQPLPVVRRPRPFNASDWLFELKYDGFRALGYVDYPRLPAKTSWYFTLHFFKIDHSYTWISGIISPA